MNLLNLIIRPIITEKSTRLAGEENKYVFQVARRATKNQIKEAIEKLFKVKVKKITTTVVKGKKRRIWGLRKEIKKSDWKKAVVQLVEGQKIDIFPEMGESQKGERK